MKNIIIITKHIKDTSSIIDVCRDWQENFSIFGVNNESEALQLLKTKEIDLVICDLNSRPGTDKHELRQLTYTYPYIPCIVIINKDEHNASDFLEIGVSSCLESPYKNQDLYRWAKELLEVTTSGTIKGLPVHSLLQMLEGEAKTCTLKVYQRNDPDTNPGFIYIEKGVVVAAEVDDIKGEEAVYSIISWDDTTINIKFYNSLREREIEKTLISLIMEALRLKDERETSLKKQESKDTAKKSLKHFSTSGKGLLLENGIKIKMEFTKETDPVTAKLVGSVPEKYIIVTKPEGFDEVQEQLQNGQRITSKYLHMGRLCMFKTALIKSIDEPDKLLFLEYPLVIHYHELRRAKRSTTFIPCTVQLPSGPKFIGVLLDISLMGCLCQIRANRNKDLPDLKIGTKIHFFCLFPGIQEEQELVGMVKNTKKMSSEIRIGLELNELPDSVKTIISQYLNVQESWIN